MKRASLVLLTGGVAGCIVSMEPEYFPIEDGIYSASWDTIVSNDCFSSGLPIPRGYPLIFEAVTTGETASIEWPALSAALVPMTGTTERDGSFDLGAVAPHVLTSSCTVAVSTELRGMGVSSSVVTFRLTLAFDAGTTAENGLPSDCSGFAGETVDEFPFPELSDPSSGSCSLTLEGIARPQQGDS